ncbi:hypothetical protein CRM22_000295, partial [Opisthorchis felineus]
KQCFGICTTLLNLLIMFSFRRMKIFAHICGALQLSDATLIFLARQTYRD